MERWKQIFFMYFFFSRQIRKFETVKATENVCWPIRYVRSLLFLLCQLSFMEPFHKSLCSFRGNQKINTCGNKDTDKNLLQKNNFFLLFLKEKKLFKKLYFLDSDIFCLFMIGGENKWQFFEFFLLLRFCYHKIRTWKCLNSKPKDVNCLNKSLKVKWNEKKGKWNKRKWLF